jgi:hypothetical protein
MAPENSESEMNYHTYRQTPNRTHTIAKLEQKEHSSGCWDIGKEKQKDVFTVQTTKTILVTRLQSCTVTSKRMLLIQNSVIHGAAELSAWSSKKMPRTMIGYSFRYYLCSLTRSEDRVGVNQNKKLWHWEQNLLLIYIRDAFPFSLRAQSTPREAYV